MKLVFAMLVCALTGGRIDYRPSAEFPWVVYDRYGLVGRRKTLWQALQTR